MTLRHSSTPWDAWIMKLAKILRLLGDAGYFGDVTREPDKHIIKREPSLESAVAW